MSLNVQTQKIGKFLLGTVEGDIHDIGKDMVHMLMDINGFEVRDLGVDVPAQRFWDEQRISAGYHRHERVAHLGIRVHEAGGGWA